MNHRVKFRIAGFICSCLITPAVSQSNENTPEAVVQSYWAAMQAGDWAKCAGLIHTDSLARVRNRANGLAKSLLVMDESGGNLRSFFEVSTIGEFEMLRDVFVLEKALQMRFIRPGFTEIIKATKRQILGTVKERDDLIHVLFRADVRLFDSTGNRLKVAEFESQNKIIGYVSKVTLPDQDNDHAEVISVKKQGPDWRLLLGAEIETELSEWQKNIDEFHENMKKLTNELLKKNIKPRPGQKAKRGIRR